MPSRTPLLDDRALGRTLVRMATEIVERCRGTEDLVLVGIQRRLRQGRQLQVENVTRKRRFLARHDMSDRQIEVLLRGGLVNWMRSRLAP